MDFALTAEQKQIKEMVSEFVDKEVKPRAAEIGETSELPADLVAETSRLGLVGVLFPEEYDGADPDYRSYAIGLEEISRSSGDLGTIAAAHMSLADNVLHEFGNEEQKRTYLTPFNEGADIDAFAFPEPGAGDDVPAMETTAIKDGDERVVDGRKLWISNGSVADAIVVFVGTSPDTGNEGISPLIVRPGIDDSFVVEGTEHRLGDRGCPTAELRFDGMHIPEDWLLDGEGDGFVQALKALNGGRITIAARSIGIAHAALDDAVTYIGERKQFDQPIRDFQAVKHELANMDTKVQAAVLLMHKAADLKMRDGTFIKEAAQAKLYAGEISHEVANEGIQIHGDYGYTKDFATEHYYRDTKFDGIYEGTSEILRNAIGDWPQK